MYFTNKLQGSGFRQLSVNNNPDIWGYSLLMIFKEKKVKKVEKVNVL